MSGVVNRDTRDWGAMAKTVAFPTIFGAGMGAAMSLVSRPQYRGAIIGTGAAFGALMGVAIVGGTGLYQEKPQQVGTGRLPVRFP